MVKKLKYGFHKVYGRSKGRICSYHLGGGHKKLYRFIDYKRVLTGVPAKIIKIEKDPYRSAPLFLVGFSNGLLGYHLGISGLGVGDYLEVSRCTSSDDLDQSGLSCPLGVVKVGCKVHNIEFYPGSGGALSRSAGSFSVILKKYPHKILLKLSSGEYRLFSSDCLCTIGRVSGINHKEINLIKAGRVRWLGRRPIVRGQAMNPIDHPHGGRTNGGKVPVTPWGRIAKGKTTRKRRKNLFIVKRRRK